MDATTLPGGETRAGETTEHSAYGTQYNRKMMMFLKTQLDKVKAVTSPRAASQEEVALFDSKLEEGERLLACSRAPFDVRDFCSIGRLRTGVEGVCQSLKEILQCWRMHDTLEFKDEIPEEDVQEDELHLQMLLSYILKGDCTGIDDELMRMLDPLKEEHERRLVHLRVVDQGGLTLGHCVGESRSAVVFQAEWSEQAGKVAVKKPKGHVPIEEYACLIQEAAVQAALRDCDFVVQLYAATLDGWLVMELADTDLHAASRDRALGWKVRLKLLQQASLGLSRMHCQTYPLIHSDVKPTNFLVFGKTPAEYLVKVSDFGHASELRGNRSKTARLGEGAPQYIAPETYNAESPTTASDVFSFGVIMYEVVTGRNPYETIPGCVEDLVIMRKKLEEEEPCVVEDRDCPKEMRELMKRCCRLDPQSRPHMAEVSSLLQLLPDKWLVPPANECKEMDQLPKAVQLGNHLDHIIEEIEGTNSTMYGQRMAHFLQSNVRRLERPLVMPSDAPEQQWREDAANLRDHLELGLQLLRQLSVFDDELFCKTADAKRAVERVLNAVHSFALRWDLQNAPRIATEVPAMCSSRDREDLNECLARLFEDRSFDFEGVGEGARRPWERARLRFIEKRWKLSVVPEQDIIRLGVIAKDVWHVQLPKYNQSSLVAKQVVQTDGYNMEMQDLMKFFNAAFSQTLLDSRYVVELRGVTKAGALVMESAKNNMRQWYRSLTAVDRCAVALKIGALSQAARALYSVHGHGIVHGAVKSTNFLMFGNEKGEGCIVKIVGLRVAPDSSNSTCSVSRAVRWTAGELYEGAVPSMESDAFSFGTLMYEVVTGKLPYRHRTTAAEVMRAKLCGEEPCHISEQLRMLWRSEILELMRACCAMDPKERPSMDDVCSCLEMCAKQQKGTTCLHWAAEQGLTAMTTLELTESNVDSEDHNGWTPLMFAAENGHTATAELLLNRGACVNLTKQNSWTPLILAADGGHMDTAELLVDRGASVDMTNKMGDTPLMYAADGGHGDMAEMLLSRCATVDIANENGRTALMFAGDRGHTSIVRLLLDQGASVSACHKGGWTPLMFAADGGHVATMELLLKQGASVNTANKNGWTALMLAVRGGHSAATKLLLAHGANVNFTELNGWTPIMFAAHGGHLDIAKVLLDKFASVAVASKNGWMPLMLAKEHGHNAVAELLERTRSPVEFAEQLQLSIPTSRKEAKSFRRVLCRETPDIEAEYELGEKLGQGKFGITRMAVNRATTEKAACKSILKRKILGTEEVEREIEVMHHLAGHPNIVQLKGVYEDRHHIHLVMELCSGGQLLDRIVSKGRYSERDAATACRTMVQVVSHCHKMGVIHRDLKPENFLLVDGGDEPMLKAIDFGLSVFFQEGEVLEHIVGSPYYVAPEVLQKHHGKELDIWSCGVILYILLSGTPPFNGRTEAQIFDSILKGSLDLESGPWPRISKGAKDCVQLMLCREPRERASASELLQHPWLKEDGTASEEPLDHSIVSRIQHFSAMNKLKKEAFKVIATCMPKEEIEGLKRMFHEIDADNSGTITVDELRKGLHNKGEFLPESELQRLMDDMDVDGNGVVDYNEFLAATLNLRGLQNDEKLMMAFKHFDTDNSGYITHDELIEGLRETGSSEDSVRQILAEVDKDDDGRIDYEEFCAMMISKQA
ncbi:unnamed protein product [Ostreobium quekettii]|uniref:Uncharacterized protein n=1 Tax=Ostreobium quekettii TaxID=121088 RepID=A0A8S1IW58_9CHLO|nr:unnamed protein product [Ostreobium quekettii]